MNKYRDKSNEEISRAVVIELGAKKITDDTYIDANRRYDLNTTSKLLRFDPCNNPADAMPIVIENGISLFAPGLSGMWTAGYVDYEADREYGVDNYEAINKNPYRAAMEVFLMMKDAEK